MVRTRLNIGCRYSTPVRERPLHPTRGHFTPEPSQTQAPVTPATEPERRAGGSLTTQNWTRSVFQWWTSVARSLRSTPRKGSRASGSWGAGRRDVGSPSPATLCTRQNFLLYSGWLVKLFSSGPVARDRGYLGDDLTGGLNRYSCKAGRPVWWSGDAWRCLEFSQIPFRRHSEIHFGRG